MFLTNFGLKYPELAKKETKLFIITGDDREIPKGGYVIEEMYCTDPKCDCRKVGFVIIGPNKEIYYLDYGFEKPEYYMKWGIGNMQLAREMSGLSVNTFSGNIEDNKKMFEIMKYVLQDEKYIERLKRHYELMKKEVEGYEDPFIDNDYDIDDYIVLNDNDDKNIKSQSLEKKVLKERKKKKLAKKQKQINRKKKK